MAIVDLSCKVMEIESLRIVDSSIFPTVPNGNTNGASIMVVEKAADIKPHYRHRLRRLMLLLIGKPNNGKALLLGPICSDIEGG